jgi:hypothetical protein
MRRTILFSLFSVFALVAVSAAHDACAQRRGGPGFGFARGGHSWGAWAGMPYGYGYAYLPYGPGYAYPAEDFGAYPPQPAFYQPPAPPAVVTPVHPVVTEYKWPAAGAAASTSATSAEVEPQAFAIVLKDGSTLSAVMIFSADDGLHYIDRDDRHLRISMSEVDRAATLKLNRGRNLNLHLPAAQ